MNVGLQACGLEVESGVDFGFFLGKPLVFQWMTLWARCA